MHGKATKNQPARALWPGVDYSNYKTIIIVFSLDVGLAKIFKKYNILQPPRGYWGKRHLAKK